MGWKKILLIVIGVIMVGGVSTGWYLISNTDLDLYGPMYSSNCSSCHGGDMLGGDGGPALVGVGLTGGDDHEALQFSIREQHPALNGFVGVLEDVEVKGLAIYVGEYRLGQRFTEFRYDRELNLPEQPQTSEVHSFSIETVIDNLDPLIFSIEPLPDGSILVSEKERGLSVVDTNGVQSALIEGTPQTGGSFDIMGIQYGSGWLLDVATHPDYANNGWIYLHYTHLLGDEDTLNPIESSMNRLDRGRIVDGQWTDVETIWQAPEEFYVATPDTGAGGRIAFDDAGHVYISVGIKSAEGTREITSQDLNQPYGKIHRINDDGSIPLDNPYAASDNTVQRTIWTYGHRSPQGLEWHPERGTVWNSEMGPRGGDELNELLPGRNYGWPFFSEGLEYSGVHVERHKLHSLEFDASEVQRTLVNITPSPAISSFIFYTGDKFPNWRNNVLIGSLKGSSLFRMVFDGDKFLHQETLIKDLARIRDIEVADDGLIYLLLEREQGSSIVRLVPDNQHAGQSLAGLSGGS
ncbi:MAG: PQQ-dependent sugar dehydrogenase [Pseudomonadota bacterium]